MGFNSAFKGLTRHLKG